MSTSRKWLLAGAAAAALVGGAIAASAASPDTHVITLKLPGGGVEQITYTGNIKPRIEVLPNAAFVDPFAVDFMQPVMQFWSQPEMAELDRISARMDRQMDAMFAHARAMESAAQSGQLNAAFHNMGPGMIAYSQTTTWTGNGVCTQSVRMSEPANGGKPQYVSNTTGDCGSAPAHAAPSNGIPAKATGVPHLIQNAPI